MLETESWVADDPQSLPRMHGTRVLLVDDQMIIAEAIRRLLTDERDIEFHYVVDATTAVQTAIDIKPTVILQDLVMPKVDGFDLVRQYRSEPATRDVPVIMLSSKEDPAMKAQSFAVGANDYLVKLPDRQELVARVRYHSRSYIHMLERDEAFRFLRDSQQKLAQANIELAKLAALDGLTGIANRRRFDEILKTEWQRAQRDKTPLSLLMCDVDFFKLYNDSNGHPAGDLCLQKVAAVLTGNLRRPADLVARYGGEEFAVILPGTDQVGATLIAEACRAQVEELAMTNPAAPLGVATLSIGVANWVSKSQDSPEDLLLAADKALYDAKQGGRNRLALAGRC